MAGLFPLIMAAQPLALVGTGAAIATAGQQATSSVRGYEQSSNNLNASFAGEAQQAQAVESKSVVGRGLEVVEAAAKSQVVMKLFGEAMNRLKAQIQRVEANATGNGFVVTPIGLVVLGPTHYAQISAAAPYGSAALAWKFGLQALGYNAQIIAIEAAVALLDYAQGQVLQGITDNVTNSINPSSVPSTVDYPNYMPPPQTAGALAGAASSDPAYGLAGAHAPLGALGGATASAASTAATVLSPGLAGAGHAGVAATAGSAAAV